MKPLGASWGLFGGLLGPLLGLLGASWGTAGGLGGPLGAEGSECEVAFPLFGPSEAVKGASWTILGLSWAVLGTNFWRFRVGFSGRKWGFRRGETLDFGNVTWSEKSSVLRETKSESLLICELQ